MATETQLRTPQRRIQPGQGLGVLPGLGLGIALMYYLDPRNGARRRARVREGSIHAYHRSASLWGKARRDAINRGHGFAAMARNVYTRRGQGLNQLRDDDVLVAQIRAKLGRYVSHPHAVHVTSTDGNILLTGLILAHEVRPFLRKISRLPGVKEIENRLAIHTQEERIPSLQGGVPRLGEKADIFQSNWAPSTRLLLGALGALLSTSGTRRRNLSGTLLSFLGFGVFLRAYTNTDLRQSVGLRRPNEPRKTA